MKTIRTEKKLCLICMEEHDVETIIHSDVDVFKEEDVTIDTTYEYCNHKGVYLEQTV